LTPLFLKGLIKEILYFSDARKVKIIGHIPLPAIAEKEKQLGWQEAMSQFRIMYSPFWKQGLYTGNYIPFQLEVKV